MVELIQFLLLDVDVDDAKNPLEDAAFMAQIGAKLISEANDSPTYTKYELRNAATGTRFIFCWYPFLSGDGGVGFSLWRLEKEIEHIIRS